MFRAPTLLLGVSLTIGACDRSPSSSSTPAPEQTPTATPSPGSKDETVRNEDVTCDGPIECNKAGALAAQGNGGREPDGVQAIKYFKRACELGDPFGCANAGLLYDKGKLIVQSYSDAATFYRKACDLGNGQACSSLGSQYQRGHGFEADDTKAVPLYARACSQEYAQGCVNLGVFTEQGRGGLEPAPRQAAALFEKACNLDYGLGCRYLGMMHRAGEAGLQPDATRANALYRKACDLGEQGACCDLGDATACLAQASLLESGTKIEKDLSDAAQYYRQACEGNITEACDWVARHESQ